MADETFTIEEDVEPQDFLLDVRTGEQLPATPSSAAALLAGLREMQDRARLWIRACEDVLVEESRRQGSKTLRIDGSTFEVYEQKEVQWDTAKLRELLPAGLPEGRFQELVTVTVEEKVSANEAKKIAAVNPEYARIIGQARRDGPTISRVRMKH